MVFYYSSNKKHTKLCNKGVFSFINLFQLNDQLSKISIVLVFLACLDTPSENTGLFDNY